jgi:multidrug efflux pump subunit AcrB
MIVLFGLVLAVGMLVDNAIVIVDNIYRHHCEGMSRVEAARVGASEVAWPVTTSTLTTIAAFYPLLNWPGVMGQFMGFLPRTLIVSLSASLFVGLVINPAICAEYVGIARKGRTGDGGGAPGAHPVTAWYERLLRGALNHRAAVLLLGFGFLLLSVQLYGRFGRGQELFPTTQPRNATVSVRFPQGTAIERTDAAMREIEAKLGKYEDVRFFQTTVGVASSLSFGVGGGAGTHEGQIRVEFVPFDERKGDTVTLVERMREDIGQIAGAEVKVERERMGPPTGLPISIELSGDDFDSLGVYAKDIMREIETVPGLVDLQDDLEETLPEVQFRVDRNRAAMLGADTDTVGMFLRTALYGTEASKFRVDEDEFDITLRLPEADRRSVDVLGRMALPVAGGAAVPLTSLGTFSYEGGRGKITRKDQKRVVTISGDNQGRGVDEIIADIRPRVSKIPLPPGYSVKYAGDTEEMRKAFSFLLGALGIAVALIAVIIVIQFNSIVLPSIIMFTVILSMNGVMWGLLICRMKFGVVMTGLGVISLAGVVVNNAIVLIDCMLQRRAEGMGVTEAIVTAGKLRLRPVLLTAITTVLGLIPMAAGWGIEVHEWPPRIVASAETSSWWAPMAVSVIFGLSLATLLTLVLVPVMCSLAESARWRWRQRREARRGEA